MRCALLGLLLLAAPTLSAQPVPVPIRGVVSEADLAALLPDAPIRLGDADFTPTRAWTWVRPDRLGARSHAAVEDEARGLRLMVVAVTDGLDPLDRAFAPSDTLVSEPHPVISGRLWNRQALLTEAAPGRVAVASGPDSLWTVLPFLLDRVDTAALARLGADSTVRVDPYERDLVTPAYRPPTPLVGRLPTTEAFRALLPEAPDGWDRTVGGLRVQLHPYEPDTPGATQWPVMWGGGCYVPRDRTAPSVRLPTEREFLYQRFNPVYVCGNDSFGPPEAPPPQTCLTFAVVPEEAPVDSLLAGFLPDLQPETLGERPVFRLAPESETPSLNVRQWGARLGEGLFMGVATTQSRSEVEGLIRQLRLPTAAVPRQTVAVDTAEGRLWEGVYVHPEAPRRLVVQVPHEVRIETAWPDGWTWTDPDDYDRRLWLSEAGSVDPRDADAFVRSAASGLAVAFFEGVRPDRVIGLRGTIDDERLSRIDLDPMFRSWTVIEAPAPINVPGTEAAVRFALAGDVDGAALVAHVVVFAWRDVRSEAVAVLAPRAEAARARQTLDRLLSQTLVASF